MPEGADAQVTIDAVINPDGAQAGAEKVVESVDKIEESTEGAGEAGKKLVEQFGSLRSAHHALEAISEIARGGTEAIAGEAGAVRFLGEAFESLIPGGALLIALATVVDLGAKMIARQQEHAEKLADGKEAEDGFKDAATAANEAAKSGIEAAAASLKNYLDIQRQVLDVEKARAEATQARIKVLEAESESTTKLTLAGLELQKQNELGDATSPAQRAAIEARYKAREASVTGEGADAKYALEQQALDAQQSADQDEQRTRQKQVDDDQAKLDALKSKAGDAAQKAEDWGDVNPDATGSFEGAEKKQEEATEAASKAYKKAQDENAPVEEVKAAQNFFIIQQTKLADIRDAQTAHEDLTKQGPELQKSISANTDALDKLTAALANLPDQRNTVDQNYEADKQKEQAQQEADAAAAQNKGLEDQAAQRKAQRENDQLALQNQLDVLPPNDPRRGSLELQIAQSKASQLYDDKYTKIATGEIPATAPKLQPDESIVDAESPQAQSYDLKAQGLVAQAQGRAQNKKIEKQKKDNTSEIENLTGQIEGMGNKPMVEAMKRVLEVFKGKADEASQLNEIGQLAAVLAGDYANFKAETKRNISDLRGSVNKLK